MEYGDVDQCIEKVRRVSETVKVAIGEVKMAKKATA